MCRFIQYIVLYASFCAPYKKQFNSLFEVTYAPQQLKGWSFTVSGAMDRGSLLGNNYGGMLVIRKQGIIKSGNK